MRCLSLLASAAAVAIATSPATADPFRPEGPRVIDPAAEAAFSALFEQGDYRQAEALLEEASESEPITHAMQATLAYLNEDWGTLGTEADQTLSSATQLLEQDPLRGHIYSAVGHFMEGAHALSTQDTVRATPLVLNKLRLVFDHFDQAAEISPDDPELNLIRGYMDLILAVNLPFSSPDEAVDKFSRYGAPGYLVNRGLAIAHRDLNRYDEAVSAVNRALQQTPENPDLFYLKAQILRLQGELDESIFLFDQALQQQAQLPVSLANQIAWERCRASKEIDSSGPSCRNWVSRWRRQADRQANRLAVPTNAATEPATEPVTEESL